MAISTMCPHCESRFTLSDGMRGKQVRCKKCNGVFAVEETVLDAQDATAAVSSGPVPFRGPRAEKAPDLRARPRRREEEEDRFRDRRSSGGSNVGLVVGLSVGGGVLLLLLIGLGLFFVFRPREDPSPPPMADNPLGFPFANLPQGFPDMRQLPRQGADLPANADPITVAVSKLKSDDVFSQSDAAKWLEKEKVNEARRGEVVAALKGVIENRRPLIPRTDAVKALATWATRDDTPYFIALLDDNDNGVKEETLYGLAKLKDPRAAEAIVAVYPHHRDPAREALRAIGPGAEAAVRTLLNSQDNGIRIEACKLLKLIGTPASHQALLEAAEDTDNGVAEAARNALPADKRPAVYGPQLMIKVCVVNAGQFPQLWPEVEEKFKALADSARPKCKVNTSGDCKWVELSPVKCDAETFGRKINFARVTAVHKDQRLLYVELGR
jgi:predicted Zn finger-like uncharacterized protein